MPMFETVAGARRIPPQPEPTLGGLLVGIASSAAEGARSNKLASLLALIGLVVFIPLTFGSKYDERPRYRQVILPEIERLEESFFGALTRSENGPTPTWQLYHFIDAHRRASDVLEYLRLRRPVSPAGIRAHNDLILYYELADEHLAIIRTEMSLSPGLDFLARWEQAKNDIRPLRDRWLAWLDR